MRKMAAKTAKDHFGELLDIAQREPVTIEKKGRPVAVVISLESFQELENTSDAYWVIKAKEAKKKGFLGEKKSLQLLEELINVKD